MKLENTVQQKSSPPRTIRRRAGLGLVEVMLCMTIGSMLLTAVAVAFKGSFNSYKDSQQRGQMLNGARGFMSRITGDIRMCDSAVPYDPTSATSTSENSQFNAGTMPGSPTSGFSSAGGSGVCGIQMVKTHADSWDPLASPTNPVIITYWLDAANTQVLMTRKYGSVAPTPSQVCNFAQTLQIYMMPIYVQPNSATGWAGGYVMRRAVVDMTLANKNANGARILSDGGQDLLLSFSDAAVPRKTYPGL
jgi:hypothetical protein